MFIHVSLNKYVCLDNVCMHIYVCYVRMYFSVIANRSSGDIPRGRSFFNSCSILLRAIRKSSIKNLVLRRNLLPFSSLSCLNGLLNSPSSARDWFIGRTYHLRYSLFLQLHLEWAVTAKLARSANFLQFDN